MTLSVLTLLRGRLDHARNMVRGLQAATRPPDELVVARMGGPDPRAALTGAPCPVQVVDVDSPDATLPLAVARNAAAHSAHGESLVFLDVDCIPGAGLLAAYEHALAGFDGIVMGSVRYLPKGATEGSWDEMVLRRLGVEHSSREVPPGGPRQTDRYEMFWSLSFAVRRATFTERIGGFDSAFTGYGGEDTDFAFAARAAAVPLAWHGDAVAYHQDHEHYDPPLHHLHDIVANARTFRSKWGVWPMRGWLSAFAVAGYVDWTDDDLVVVGDPSSEDFARARGRAFPGAPANSP